MSTLEWIITVVGVLLALPAVNLIGEWLDWGFNSPFLMLLTFPLLAIALPTIGAFRWYLLFTGRMEPEEFK